jgi:hypothetical protein
MLKEQERIRPAWVEQFRCSLLQADRCDGAVGFPSLDRIEMVTHSRICRRGQNAAMAQRARAEFGSALHDHDRFTPVQQLGEEIEISRAGDPAGRNRVILKDRTTLYVPFKMPLFLLAHHLGAGSPEGRARVIGEWWDPYLTEASAVTYVRVPGDVQRASTDEDNRSAGEPCSQGRFKIMGAGVRWPCGSMSRSDHRRRVGKGMGRSHFRGRRPFPLHCSHLRLGAPMLAGLPG